ncbi:MAG: winged helix DNA-binding domain-containing protein [Jatrophihabitantaceae bacterium]
MPDAHPVLGERIARHGFVDRPAADAVAAAGMACGIQAQDGPASRLGVRARAAGVTDADVLRAIEDRGVVRTWLMRNTIHLVPADDARWMTALLGPMIRRRFETVRWPQLGLTPDVLDAAAAVTADVLRGRALTRHEFTAALAEHGVRISPDGQAPTHVLVYLSAIGLTCRAADRERSGGAPASKGVARGGATFTLLDEWSPDAAGGPRGDDALAELARRYFGAFSPATPADFTTWSGLPSSRAITLIRDELAPVDIDGRAGYRLGEVEPARGLRLLPAFDNYLVGYRERGFLDESRRAEVYAGGMIRPTVLLDGRIVGRWQLRRNAGLATIEVVPFLEFTRRVKLGLEAEAADLARFLGTPDCHLTVTG